MKFNKSLYSVIPIFLLLIISLAVVKLNIGESSKLDWQEKKAKGPDLRPSEWALLQRTFPYFKSDLDAYSTSLKQMKKLKDDQNGYYLSKKKSLAQWEFAGPTNIGGRITDIEFNPLDGNIVYAGAATGGVFKSTDKGVTWVPIFDDAAVFSIGDICIDPINPNIVYVGTGEANGGHNNFPGAGVYKSTNAGETWQYVGLEQSCAIGRIIIDPNNTSKIFAAAVGSYFVPNNERGLFVSTDAGATWNKSLFVSDSTGCIDIVMHPENNQVLIAAMWERVRQPGYAHLYGPTSGMFKSTNGGSTWNKITSSVLPNPNTENVGRIGLAINKTNPDLIYSIYNDGANYIGLYKSINFGNSWVNVDTDNEISAGVSNFSWYFGQIRIHPTNPNIVYALDVSFMRSTDGGQNWPIVYGYGGPEQLHVDHHALAFHPTEPNYILEGNDGGINRSTDGGVNWSNISPMPTTQFYEIFIDPNNPKRLYGGTQDNNTIRTKTGALNDWEAILGGDGMYVLVDYTNSNIIYAESQWGNLTKSTDGGNYFYSILNGINSNEPTNWSTPVVMDPANHNVLYYGTDRVYRTTNGGSSWSSISPKLVSGIYSPRLGTVTTIAVSGKNTNYIYAGTDDSQIWVSKDHGSNWTEISNGLPIRWVTRIVVDPKDENTVYATFSGLRWKDPVSHVFRSSNAGSTWEDISSNLPDAPVNAFAVDFNYSNVLYLGSDIGAFVSFNYGAEWEVLAEGLPVVPVNDMKIDRETNTLVVGTHGRSMYKVNLLNVLSDVEDSYSLRPETFSLEQNYPNPFNPNTTIQFNIPKAGNIKMNVYDALGRKVKQLLDQNYEAGSYSLNFNATGLSSGVYFYEMIYNNNLKVVKKMILAK